MICLVIGARLDAAIGRFPGKQALFRQLVDSLDPGDIVLADRYYRGFSCVLKCWREAGIID